MRGNAMSEIAALMGGGYNPPSNVPNGAAPSVNYSGMVQNGYNNEMAASQQKAQNMSSLGSIAGSLLMKCTEAAKMIDGPLSTYYAANVVASLPIAVWRYKPGEAPEGMGGEQHVGPMAEHFHNLTGLGQSDKISVIDALGILFGALQHTLARMEVMQRRLDMVGVH